jgi:rod shape-determining protein MreD
MRALRAAAVLLLGLILQASFIAQLDLFGARGDVLLLVPIAAGLTSGPERGAIAGFVTGLCVDLLVQTPFGLFALAYCLVGYGVGAFQSGVLRASRLLPIVAAVAGASLGTLFWVLAATVVGEEGLLDGHLVGVLLAVSVLDALLVLPALRLARWVEGEGERPTLGLVRTRA